MKWSPMGAELKAHFAALGAWNIFWSQKGAGRLALAAREIADQRSLEAAFLKGMDSFYIRHIICGRRAA